MFERGLRLASGMTGLLELFFASPLILLYTYICYGNSP